MDLLKRFSATASDRLGARGGIWGLLSVGMVGPAMVGPAMVGAAIAPPFAQAQAQPTPAQPTQTNAPAPQNLATYNFVDWCQRRDRLAPGAQQTIDLMLQAVGTTDCAAANQTLRRAAELVIPHGRLTDLEPITFFPQIKRLTIRENALADLSLLTALPNLEMLDLSGQPELQSALMLPMRTAAFIDERVPRFDRIVVQEPAPVDPNAPPPQTAQTAQEPEPIAEPTILDYRIMRVRILETPTEQAKGETYKNRLNRLKIESQSPLIQQRPEAQPFVPGNILRPAPLNRITDISPLENLPHLRELYLGGNNISDIRPLAKLPNLQVLSLHSNPLRYVDALEQMTQLRVLDLNSIESRDLGPVAKLRNLRALNLANNGVDDLRIIQKMSHLRDLDLSHNGIESLRSLRYLDHLERLSVDRNNISDLSPLTEKVSLQFLSIRGNQIRNLHPLQGLTQLNQLLAWDNPLDRPMCPVRRADQSKTAICYFRAPGGIYN